MIAINQRAFAIVTADIIGSDLSDLAFRVYCIVYTLNYSGSRKIPDAEIGRILRKSRVSINRAIAELRDHKLLTIARSGNDRIIAVVRSMMNDITEVAAPAAPAYDTSLPVALQHFYEGWPTK